MRCGWLIRILCCLLLGLAVMPSLQAQDEEEAPRGWTGADIRAGSRNGGGAVFRVQSFSPLSLVYGASFDLVKDPREARIESFYGDRGRRYVYGKLNHLAILRPQAGLLWQALPRTDLNRIAVMAAVQAGPSLALLSPYYVEVPSGPLLNTRLAVPFDPARYSYQGIIGRAGFLAGSPEPLLRIGAGAGVLVMLDWARARHGFSGLSLGADVNWFPSPLPVLAETPEIRNRSWTAAGSVGLFFGGKL
jgi:hypothetical protein